jgi:hypothetical protein
MEDRRGDGDAKWEVQTIVAELCPSDETHGYVWTRWIAVLRAGAEPLNVAGVHTNVANRIDWGVGHTAMDADLEPRLAEGFHLLAVASTEHTLNEHGTSSCAHTCCDAAPPLSKHSWDRPS